MKTDILDCENSTTISCEDDDSALSNFLAPMKVMYSICVQGIITESYDWTYIQVDRTAFSETLKFLKQRKGETVLPCLENIGLKIEFRKNRNQVKNYKVVIVFGLHIVMNQKKMIPF